MRSVRVFASSVSGCFGSSAENFGDALMTPLLRELFNVEPAYVEADQAELIGVGSILDAYWRYRRGRLKIYRRRPWRKLHVWGSGFMDSHTSPLWPQSLRFAAIRGPLSRARIDMWVPMGDPGLLLPLIWPKQQTRTAVVVVPHFATIARFRDLFGNDLPNGWSIVNLLEYPKAVAAEISRAEAVISSSLHGLIAADAYGIPSVWMEPTGKIKGDGFKFADYFAFRGAAINGPTPFAPLLANPQSLPLVAPAVPAHAVDGLLASFPFRC